MVMSQVASSEVENSNWGIVKSWILTGHSKVALIDTRHNFDFRSFLPRLSRMRKLYKSMITLSCCPLLSAADRFRYVSSTWLGQSVCTLPCVYWVDADFLTLRQNMLEPTFAHAWSHAHAELRLPCYQRLGVIAEHLARTLTRSIRIDHM